MPTSKKRFTPRRSMLFCPGTKESAHDGFMAGRGGGARAGRPERVLRDEGIRAGEARTSVADFTQHFALQVEAESAASVGGVVVEMLGRIPAVGVKLAIGPLELTVEEMDGPRIVSLSADRAGHLEPEK
jgi:hypothetical protein